MNYTALGILLIIGSIITFLLKDHIASYRMIFWQKLNKSKEQNEIEKAERTYRFAVIFGSIISALIGIRLLFI